MGGRQPRHAALLVPRIRPHPRAALKWAWLKTRRTRPGRQAKNGPGSTGAEFASFPAAGSIQAGKERAISHSGLKPDPGWQVTFDSADAFCDNREQNLERRGPLSARAKYFDCHFHIIDKSFPVVSNQGFMPDAFTSADYLERVKAVDVCGGAVVSGSFQAFDQSYLFHALKVLGPTFVGVTQVPQTVSDKELQELDGAGVRAVRFNIRRGGSEEVQHLETMARRVHELVGWHTELYVDSKELAGLYETLLSLPAVGVMRLTISIFSASFKS